MVTSIKSAHDVVATSRSVGPFTAQLAIMVALLALLPFVSYPVFLMKVLCYALFACAFNLLFGFGGLMSFGHAAFFGAGSYAAAWAIAALHVTPELALLMSMAVGAIVGLLFGVVTLRLKGIAFAMATLALAQMLFFVLMQAPFTGGENGLINSDRGSVLGVFSLNSDLNSYIFTVVTFLAIFALTARIVHSPFGQILKSIRDNEIRARSLGYDVQRYKLLAFVLSAAIAATAGGLKSLVLGIATLEDAGFLLSGHVVLITLVGGAGTLFGPVVGALLITGLQQYFASLGSWVTFVQGAVLVVVVLMFRRGIVGEITRRMKAMRH